MIAAIVLFAVGGIVWLKRGEVLLALVRLSSDPDIAPYQPVTWAQGPAHAEPAEGTRPPNIILILADDLGMNDISTFGGGMADGTLKTPSIDALAAGGVSFTQAYTGNATCAPSRAMLLTGRYPTRHGFEFTPTPPGMGRAVTMVANSMDTGLPPVDFDADRDAALPEFNDQGLPGSEVTIAEILKQRGYHTVHIGKWHLGTGPEFGPNAQGFDESLLMADMAYLPEDDPEVVNAKLDFDPIDRFLWARMQYAASFNGGEKFRPGGYLTDWWTDESLNVIDANRHRPFFLYLAHWGVHSPLQATRADYDAVGDIQPHRARVYAAMMRALDRSVGRILARLDETGLAENTLVVFASDNGGAGYIGIEGINAPYRGWKMTFFEGGIRTPLFMRWPARIVAGETVTTPVQHIDLMPTLAAAAGAPLPDDRGIDGVDLLPAATGTGSVTRPDNALFWQSGYYQAVRQGEWKLQVDGRQHKRWLANLSEDPTEQTNLADSEPAVVQRLTALLEQHQVNRTPPLYDYTLESPTPIDITRAQKAGPGDDYIYWPN